MSTRVATLPVGTYTDPGQTGLQLRVLAKQGDKFSRTWLLRFKFKGEETRIVLGHIPATTLDAARGLAREHREQAARGIDPRRARPRRIERPTAIAGSATPSNIDLRHTVGFLAAEFMDRHIKATRKRPEYVEKILENDVLPHWAQRDARTIKPREVIELLDAVVERGSKVMANRVAGVLSQMFRYGVHRALVDTSPVQLLFRPGGKEKPRERTLSDAELTAYLANPRACTRFERLEHVILVLLLTGQRRGELALARWADIDFKAKTWTIPAEHSKNGRRHVVPLTAWAMDEFKELRGMADQSRWVLPSPVPTAPTDARQLTRSLAKCRARFKKRGIEPFTLHDLRRTCRTGLGKLKIQPHIAERVVNHSQQKMVATYDTGEYLDEKRAALDKWARHMRSLRDAKKA